MIDFETYCEAGYQWSDATGKWVSLDGYSAQTRGLGAVGLQVYAEHPSCEILCLAYDLDDGMRQWLPGMPPPVDLLCHIAANKILTAWNVSFEAAIWHHICHKRYGWLDIPSSQLRCTMARARAHGLPGALADASTVLGLPGKQKDGKRLIAKFCCPPRVLPADDPEDFARLCRYNIQDVVAEEAIAARVPELSELELANWQLDQRINRRGVAIDSAHVEVGIAIVEQAYSRYNEKLRVLTSGAVNTASEVAKLLAWLHGAGVHLDTLDEESVTAALLLEMPSPCRRALEIRQMLGSASVKKLYQMRHQCAADGRLHDLFIYHGARTGRTTGSAVQPTNLPTAGPALQRCECMNCLKHYGMHHTACPHCGANGWAASTPDWNVDIVEEMLTVMQTRSLELVEYLYGSALPLIAGCLRGLFVASPGHDLICSDYSAIEAVVLAALAGETWRLEVFRTHGQIYEASAAAITGLSLDYILEHKRMTGKHHESRQLGKVAELACFGPDTEVLTRRGYVPIVEVTRFDRLWDGVEWVVHAGVVSHGARSTIDLDGVRVTAHHPISVGHTWMTASEIQRDEYRLLSALTYGSTNLPKRHFNFGWIARMFKKPQGLPGHVYDIAHAGYRNRFTIKTLSGHMIVHNSGYGGWLGAWKAFGADKTMSDPEIKSAILAWRAASPAIVEFWGGQFRGLPWAEDRRAEFYGLEGMAISAVLRPDHWHEVKGIGYCRTGDTLYCRLPSGRMLTYHQPELRPSERGGLALSYMTWNTNPAYGGRGWIRVDTYAGKLCENVVQAVARDIQWHGMQALEAAGYPVVLHVYDEDVAEGFGSVEEMERIMVQLPEWTKGWPVRASGGWRGKRYRK